MAFFRTLLHGGAHLFRQKTRHESIACLLTDFLGKIKFTLNQTTFLPFRKTAYPRGAPSAGARGNYKAHISKYVRHILKYLRHIFCPLKTRSRTAPKMQTKRRHAPKQPVHTSNKHVNRPDSCHCRRDGIYRVYPGSAGKTKNPTPG